MALDTSSGLWKINQSTSVDHVSTTFDQMGRPTGRTDQRGTTHAYSYDTAGRLVTDAVTACGGDTDTTIQGIKFTYDGLGRRTGVTSYTNSACTGTPANDVAWAYDGSDSGDLGWGGVKRSRQQHDDATGENSPHVDYLYADGASGPAAKYVHLAQVTYPGPSTSRAVSYNVSTTGIGAAVGQLNNIATDGSGGGQFAQYTYLGAGTIVQVDHPSVPGGFALTYKGAAGRYPGFDRVGRVVWQKWTGNGPEGCIDRYFYGYDKGSNRVWRAERQVWHESTNSMGNRDEGYVYDALGRLTLAQRGVLVWSSTASAPLALWTGDCTGDGKVNEHDYSQFISGYFHNGDEWAEGDFRGTGTVDVSDYNALIHYYFYPPERSVTNDWSWTLDALGNWAAYNATTTAGTLNQTRTHNAANALVNISTTGGGAWANPTYDAAGNMTIAPKPGDELTPLHLKYDAWNRLVRVTYDNDVPLAEYRLDGLGRRIVKIVRKMVEGNERWDRTDYFYNEAWQCLEERNQLFEGYGGANCMIAAGVYTEYLWDIRYIDAPVCRWRGTQEGGQGLDECLYYCNDANMNVTALVDTSGGVVERYQYTPYGQVTVCNSAWNVRPNGSAYGNEIQYCGYRLDPETGADSVRYRVFWPPLGRWGQGDPGLRDYCTTLYQYVQGRPVLFVDPYGLWGYDVHFKLTFELAWKAGLACPEVVAAAAEQPDKDLSRRAGAEGVSDYLSLLGSREFAAAAEKLRLMQEWHFPTDSDGIVRPNSVAAQKKVEAGKEACDINAFGEGLHVLQDSWAHQGKPYTGGVGHWRDARYVPGQYAGHPMAPEWVPAHVVDFSGTVHAAGPFGNADSAKDWPEDAVQTGIETYKWIIAFAKKCSCACPGVSFQYNIRGSVETIRTELPTTLWPHKPAESEDDVWMWLKNKRFPGKNISPTTAVGTFGPSPPGE